MKSSRWKSEKWPSVLKIYDDELGHFSPLYSSLESLSLALGSCVCGLAVNHSCQSSNNVSWPRHQRGRFPLQTGSKLISVPTAHWVSGDESGMTSHWFSGLCCLCVKVVGRRLRDLNGWSHNDQRQTADLLTLLVCHRCSPASHHTCMWNVDGCFSRNKRLPVMFTRYEVA